MGWLAWELWRAERGWLHLKLKFEAYGLECMGMKPCMVCMGMDIYTTLISHVTSPSVQDVDSQYDISWESPLPAIFCLLIGLAQNHILQSNHLACFMGANSNGFGLYLLYLAFVMWVRAISKPGPTACNAWQVLCINFLHQREVWRSVSITGLYSHIWHSTALPLSVLVTDVVCFSWFKLTSKIQFNHTLILQ